MENLATIVCEQTPETFYVVVWERIRGVFNGFQVLGQYIILLCGKNGPRKKKAIFKAAGKTKDYDKELSIKD